MTDDAGLGIAFGLFALFAVGFYDATLDLVFVFESDSLGLSLLLHHGFSVVSLMLCEVSSLVGCEDGWLQLSNSQEVVDQQS